MKRISIRVVSEVVKATMCHRAGRVEYRPEAYATVMSGLRAQMPFASMESMLGAARRAIEAEELSAECFPPLVLPANPLDGTRLWGNS
jgi:hypothetical protein